ncbi:hypothetical protein [Nocardia sp. NPDC048505]|uniref:hypothetical protein n=1 Tax=unclassified Nocardia TaxID=2637762 RepID=UPI0034023923
MGESQRAGQGSGTEAILGRITAGKAGAVAVGVTSGNEDAGRSAGQRTAQLARVIFSSSVVIGVLLLVLLCVGVTWFGFLIFLL